MLPPLPLDDVVHYNQFAGPAQALEASPRDLTAPRAAPQPFTLGVNYWPRRKAMYWWSQFDAGEVRDEFALIRELGLTLVRIFLLWDDFQPAPDQVSRERLAHLPAVADIPAALCL